MAKERDILVEKDRMRFTKNKASANLAYLAILFDVFFFVSIYKSDVSTYYYNILIGASVVYNLVFMLAAFLSSEGVKLYNENYSYLLAVLGVIQVIRIFIIPTKAHAATVIISKVETQVMTDGQFFRCVLFLIISAACCFAASVIGIYKARMLKDYMKSIETK